MKNATTPTESAPRPEDLAAILDFLIPQSVTNLGKKLVPLKAGHQLLISQIGHPLATGEAWGDSDVLMALFVFSRPSVELFALLAEDRFEAEFFAFVDSIPAADVPNLGKDLAAHWIRSRAGAIKEQVKTESRRPISGFRDWILSPLKTIARKN
jgi:hypothetical protein